MRLDPFARVLVLFRHRAHAIHVRGEMIRVRGFQLLQEVNVAGVHTGHCPHIHISTNAIVLLFGHDKTDHHILVLVKRKPAQKDCAKNTARKKTLSSPDSQAQDQLQLATAIEQEPTNHLPAFSIGLGADHQSDCVKILLNIVNVCIAPSIGLMTQNAKF